MAPTAFVTVRLQRYSRRARLYHALVYVVTFVLLGTGGWLLAGREGEPSALARVVGAPDITIHTNAGWALLVLGALVLLFGRRGAVRFVAESLTYRRSDLGWLARWPASVFTGGFGRHEGHFDPGQRIANVVMVVALFALTVTGVGLLLVRGGPAFVWLGRLHLWTSYVLAVVVAGHIVVASGLLPGYRGTWRAMHWGGRVEESLARRLWPAWLERELGDGHRQAD